ncbi:strigolactones hydrolase CXE15-like [Silene latifolia]|uniref:strigolactones hydrolase CXE15-like n=1 Tax=Silene latifolia TaxID=37657 RepID=UPI003D77A7D4
MSYVVEDCRGVLKLMSDGSVIRSDASFFPTQLDDAKYPSIMWHDLVFDPLHDLKLRLYEHGSSKTAPANSTIVFYIAHNWAVRVAMGSTRELNLDRVKGYMLLAPMFGGSERTKSELEGPTETFLSLEGVDRYWRLCLPFGPTSPELKSLDLGPMHVMVGETDILRDGVRHYASRLSSLGKPAKYVEFKGLAHGFMISDYQ